MKIDLHIHSKEGSDGKMSLPEIFEIADRRGVNVISITDHDSIDCQERAKALAAQYGMHYITGVEINISFSHPDYRDAKPVSLDVLGYEFDFHNPTLTQKLVRLREYRRQRAEKILEKLNEAFLESQIPLFTEKDMEAIDDSVEGAFGRPHIADYLVKKGIVSNRQQAFDKYLVRCNVPKMPVTLQEASGLVRGAGGKLMLAHPSNPHGTSLVSFTPSIKEQQQIIKDTMLPYLDGIECWHSSHDSKTVKAYLEMAKEKGLLVSGGSDCHQAPLILGTVHVPSYVAKQFDLTL